MATDVLSTVDRIAREVVAPEAAAVDAKALFPAASLKAVREAGLLGLVTATDQGGLGGTLRTAAQTVERLARSCGSTAMPQASSVGSRPGGSTSRPVATALFASHPRTCTALTSYASCSRPSG